MDTRRATRWCFTDYKFLDWKKLHEEKDNIRYIGFGDEICPKTKRKHLQGWIQLVNGITRNGLKKLVDSKQISIRICKGSIKANEKYCHKDGKWTEYGEFVTQGARTDIWALKEIIDNGGDLLDVAEADFGCYLRYNRGFEKYKQMIDEKRRKEFRKVEVAIIKGPTGCGKTKRAVETCPDYYKISGDNLQWFDGYNGEKTLVIDEYDNQIPCTKLLSILDGYQYRLPVKGGFTYANWDRVILTTNNKTLHENAKPEHQNALKRRITKVINWFKKQEVVGNTSHHSEKNYY